MIMRNFKLAFRTAKQASIANQSKRAGARVRLMAEPLETREAPAVGKWFPPPEVSKPLGDGLVQVADTSLIDTQVILTDTTASLPSLQAAISFEMPSTMVPTETGNP
jgi:hypothetical protein